MVIALVAVVLVLVCSQLRGDHIHRLVMVVVLLFFCGGGGGSHLAHLHRLAFRCCKLQWLQCWKWCKTKIMMLMLKPLILLFVFCSTPAAVLGVLYSVRHEDHLGCQVRTGTIYFF